MSPRARRSGRTPASGDSKHRLGGAACWTVEVGPMRYMVERIDDPRTGPRYAIADQSGREVAERAAAAVVLAALPMAGAPEREHQAWELTARDGDCHRVTTYTHPALPPLVERLDDRAGAYCEVKPAERDAVLRRLADAQEV